MTKKLLLLLAFFAILISNAQNIFRDDFSSYNAGVSLHGQGSWTNDSNAFGLGGCVSPSATSPCSNAIVSATPISYPNYGSSSKSVLFDIIKDNPGRAILPIISGGVFYVSVVLNLSNAPVGVNAADFIRIANSSNGSITARLLVQEDGFGYKIGIKKGPSNSTNVLSNVTYNLGENVLVVLKYTYNPSFNDDELKMFVNPDFASGEPAVASATTTNGFDQSDLVDRFALRFGSNTAGSLPNGYLGLVSVARTWADLSQTPLTTSKFDSNNITILSKDVFKGILNINSNVEISNAKLNIYTITGALIESQNISIVANNNEVKINPINNNSIYIAEIIDDAGNKYTKKITIN